MRIFDAHLHYGRPKPLFDVASASPLRGKFPCYSIVQYDRMDSYEERLAEHGVEKTVLVPFVFRELDKGQESRLVLDYARTRPGAYYPYALLDEEDPTFVEEHFREIVGLKEHIVLHETVLAPRRKEIFACMEQCGLTLLLHSNSERRIGYVTEIMANFPRMKVQIAHMGRDKTGSVPFMLQVLEAMRPYETVFFDTSTVRIPEVVAKAVDIVGPGRILYGSDFPFFMDPSGQEDIMDRQIRHILDAGLSQRQQEMIFSENFEHFITFGH